MRSTSRDFLEVLSHDKDTSWYWARTRDKASHGPIPIPLVYRDHGRQIEQVLSDHCLCLLNHEEPTYFHEPTRSFHTIDLAICSPSLLPHLNLSVEKDLYNSDHFPVIHSHDSDPGGKTFPPTYSYRRADWALFTQLAVITDAMVKTESVNTAV
ncbi:hypothetical protein TNCV_4894971 [Trichonephila clavipes]|nr:hypothetical protein TNCV_4894971 [Trichonephila clavipes]